MALCRAQLGIGEPSLFGFLNHVPRNGAANVQCFASGEKAAAVRKADGKLSFGCLLLSRWLGMSHVYVEHWGELCNRHPGMSSGLPDGTVVVIVPQSGTLRRELPCSLFIALGKRLCSA